MVLPRSLVASALVAALAIGWCAGGQSAAATDALLRVRALERLVRAAAANDEPGMWAALSRASRRRLGPTLTDFRRRGARGVRSSLAPFVRGFPRVIVNAAVGRGLGVIAVAGRSEYGAFAAPIRLERGAWRVEIDPAITIEAVRPLPEERVQRRTQLFAEAVAPARIDGSGMWFDGVPFGARTYWSRDGTHVSVWGEAPQPLARGGHTVVAFATARSEAAASAWVFTVTVPGGRSVSSD